MRHRTRTTLVAVSTAVVLVLGVPVPASASSPADVTAGTLTVHTFPTQVFDLAPDGDGPCPAKQSTVTWTFTPENPDNPATPHHGTWTRTGGSTTFFRLGNPPSGQWYQADDLDLVATGTYTWTSPTTYVLATTGPNQITFQRRVYAVDHNDCDKHPLVCSLTMRRVATSSSGSGTIPPSPNDIIVEDSTSNIAGGLALVGSPCQQPFSSMNGAHVTVAGLTYTF